MALALHSWSRLHGLMSLAIYGHLQTQAISPEKPFREELSQLVRLLDITP
ncbi:hypothetical protein PV721_34810 [Streptomyces sp. MB09-01]|nr:hypothetical protein [Streptomyces sp. MB09-01]MDX3539410.1 hypothetical protein [Streptomyces sp. MB09-01]